MPIEQWLQLLAVVLFLVGVSIVALIAVCAAIAKEAGDDAD